MGVPRLQGGRSGAVDARIPPVDLCPDSRPDSRALGAAGEQAAARDLERDGWTILGRNVRVGRAEIDIIAERRGAIAIVEVKSRRRGARVSPREAADDAKTARLEQAAGSWMRRHGIRDARWVMLLAAVELDAGGRPGEVTWQTL